MNVFLDNDKAIEADKLISIIHRSDLVPIPQTIEVLVKESAELNEQLTEGKMISYMGVDYSIVTSQAYGVNNLSERRNAIHVLAVLAGLKSLIRPNNKPISLTNTSMAEVYQALGAKVSFDIDIPIKEFICLKGSFATERIAITMQKEGAVISPRQNSNKISAVRLSSIFDQKANNYENQSVSYTSNSIKQDLKLGNFLSVDRNANSVGDVNNKSRSFSYMADVDERQIKNLSQVLITVGSIERQTDHKLFAGGLINIGKSQDMALLTVGNRFDTGALGGSPINMTKAWIAQIRS